VQGTPDWVDEVIAAGAGDLEARATLVRRFTPLVRSTARRLTDADAIDDVAQQSFEAALRALPGLRTPEAFPSWLRLIVRREASRLRDARTSPINDDDHVDNTSCSDPSRAAEVAELAAVVRVALGQVSDQDRRLLELRYLAGWTNDELAVALDLSPGALRKRLHDARRRLRPHLEHLNPKETTVTTDYRQYLGSVHDAGVKVPEPPPLGPTTGGRTVTGLKVIDAMAPLRRGGCVEIVGPLGTGHLVLVLELLYRLGRTERDVACVATGRLGAEVDLRILVTETGIPGPNVAVLADGHAEITAAFDASARLASGLAAAGHDVALVVDQSAIDHLDRSRIVAAAGLAAEGSVTVVAVRARDRGKADPASLGFETRLVLSIEQFALGIFPAIDPLASSSELQGADAGADVRRRLADAAELREWFGQPMFLAEDYTGEKGIWVEPATSERELARLTAT
jgi:RNA polymerase sigma-70 factor (ECF subfamily)